MIKSWKKFRLEGVGPPVFGSIFVVRILEKLRWLLAALSGLLLTLAFANFNIAGLAWIAPLFLIVSAFGCSLKKQWMLGLVSGLCHFLTSLYWLLNIPFPAGAVAGWLALSAYCSVQFAIWVVLSLQLLERMLGAHEAEPDRWKKLNALSTHQKLRWAFIAAVFWVGLEFIRGRFLSGFPWNFLGVSQFKLLPLAQIASVTGVLGLSFLVVYFSVSLLFVLGLLLRNAGARIQMWTSMFIPLTLVMATFGWGYKRLQGRIVETGTLRVALIQPSIPQLLMWDPGESQNRFRKLMDLSAAAMDSKPGVIIWPEAALPALGADNFQTILEFIRSNQVSMIFGADDTERTPVATNSYNSCFLFSPEGKFLETYRKRRLVIFGEYVPLKNLLPFLKYLTPVQDGFSAGTGPVLFRIPGTEAICSPIICFEDAFSDICRQHTTSDTDFLLNLTNDGWFGESAEHWQQAFMAAFRAIENGVPLVRCTNNGITCWFDRHGRLKQFFSGPTEYSPGFLIADIPLGTRTETYFHRHGDILGIFCSAITLLACARGIFPQILKLKRR